jgi:hypothetical protein
MTTLNVPVKPYIKKYLEKNYGNPVNFSGVRGLSDFFNLLLEKQTLRREKQTTLNRYSELVTIVITRDVFYRYGWSISNTSVVSFNALFEMVIKERGRDAIRIRKDEANKKISESIRQYQIDFGFTEDDFPFDTIKKDVQRHTNISKKGNKNIGLIVPKKIEQCLEV